MRGAPANLFGLESRFPLVDKNLVISGTNKAYRRDGGATPRRLPPARDFGRKV